MQTRKSSLVAAAVGAAVLTCLGMAGTAVAAPAATHDVLTISKVGGTAAKDKAKLEASLKSKTDATFAASGLSVSCKKSTFTAKVTKNPKAPGTADESLTKQTFGGCSGPSGVTVKSITINKLPYKTTVSDRKGDPVTVSKLSTTMKVSVSGIGTLTCTYTAKSIKGAASNKDQTITFSKQKFTSSSGDGCPTSATFSATYGPVKDTSVKHDPRVFIN